MRHCLNRQEGAQHMFSVCLFASSSSCSFALTTRAHFRFSLFIIFGLNTEDLQGKTSSKAPCFPSCFALPSLSTPRSSLLTVWGTWQCLGQGLQDRGRCSQSIATGRGSWGAIFEEDKETGEEKEQLLDMGCCSVSPRSSGTDEVGPDELELLDIGSTGVWALGESKLKVSTNEIEEPPEHRPSVRQPKREAHAQERQEVLQPITSRDSTQKRNSQVVLWEQTRDELHQRLYTTPVREWEGQTLHSFGDIIHSSLLYLHNSSTKISERYVVLFSFHLLILALDNLNQNFIYEGILPLSAVNVRVISQQDSTAPPMFEISGAMVDSKTFICDNAAERKYWLENIEDRRNKSLRQQLSPSHSALSYLLPCNERWKKEELKRYLLKCPISQWEGTPIQHMGQPAYLSLVHISNIQQQGSLERLFILYPRDLLILSVDRQRVHVKYEGRLPCKSIRALERSALPGRLEFELTGDLMEPLLVSCDYPEDYQSWIFQLQQPEKVGQIFPNHTTPPVIPKKQKS